MELVLVQGCFWSEHWVTLQCEHKKYVSNNSAEPKQVIYLKGHIFLKLCLLTTFHLPLPRSTSGLSPRNGTGDPSGVDGPRGHLPPHLLLPAAGRKRAGQLCWAQVHRGPAGGLAAQSGGRSDSFYSHSGLSLSCGAKRKNKSWNMLALSS